MHVGVRVRPGPENFTGSCPRVLQAAPADGCIHIFGEEGGDDTVLRFGTVFGPDASQALVYKSVCGQMAEDVAGGKSAIAIVAGPPHSGKRFSLVGKLSELVGMGLVPRLAADILARIESLGADANPLYCMMGIYQVMGVGRVRDLLSIPAERRVLEEERLAHNRRRMTVQGLTRERVDGLVEVMLVLERACKAASGASGHLVIEISTHTHTHPQKPPARSSPGPNSGLQGIVGRVVLFGLWDCVEPAAAARAPTDTLTSNTDSNTDTLLTQLTALISSHAHANTKAPAHSGRKRDTPHASVTPPFPPNNWSSCSPVLHLVATLLGPHTATYVCAYCY